MNSNTTTSLTEQGFAKLIPISDPAVGLVVGLVAGNKEIREQLNQKSKQLLNND